MPRFALPALENLPGGRGLASLSRRVRALIVTGVLFVVLFVLVLTMHVPYVILSPGPTVNTLGTAYNQQVIVIKGRTANVTKGNLNLTTVREGDEVTAFQAIVGWLKSDETVVPYSSVNPPGQSQQQTEEQNTADFSDSQNNALAAASCQLKYPKKFGIVGVQVTGAAHGKLLPGDVLDTLDGKSASSQSSLFALLNATKPGQTVALGVTRAGKATTVSVKLGQPLQGRTGGSLGISPGTICALPFSVDLGLGNQIGGPSAGLMFALGIMDKVGSQDLTGGRFIAGTGTIDASGNVGPIGGIALKMIAARRAGATVFLAPSGNCADVKDAIPGGLKVVKVSTLAGAVSDLLAIQKNQAVPSCS